jgi:glyoxylase-like metal-dependent hydrolase (beta-lactamase superfamily II)
LGGIRVDQLGGGDFLLDGGTMFGAVPKVLWQKKWPADEDNYLYMINAPLLVRTATANLLIDSGLGNKLTDKQQKIFRVCRQWSLPEELAALGLERGDIDFVILTHCDYDHAGGIVMENKGSTELTFPRARHIIQTTEWFDACHPNSRSAHTYWPVNFAGLEESGLLELVDGRAEVVKGVSVELTGGHTRGHQLIHIQGESASAVHLGDVLPAHTHTNPLWIMAYDNFPLDIIAKKEELLPRFQGENCWFTFYHDPAMFACRLDEKGQVVEKI